MAERIPTILRFDQWPDADRQLWAVALAPGDLLDPGGPAAAWREGTVRIVAEAYGRWLSWLAGLDMLRPGSRPDDRCTSELVVAYACDLATALSPGTVSMALVNLQRALAVMAPDRDWRFILRLKTRLGPTNRSPLRKRDQLCDVRDLARLGEALMDAAETDPSLSSTPRALQYRDGLLIAFLAARPLRRRNVTGLELGRQLVKEGDRWRIRVPGAETKSHRPIDLPFPQHLVARLERYLTAYRPVLAAFSGGLPPDAGPLWIAKGGQPLTPHTLSLTLARRTMQGLGKRIAAHMFRDCVATSIAIHDPDKVRIAQQLLGHASFATTEAHYNLAQTLDAADRYQETLLAYGAEPGRCRYQGRAPK